MLTKLRIFMLLPVAIVALSMILRPPLPNPTDPNISPSFTGHWLGTSAAGYDIFHLVVYATIRSVFDAGVATALTILIAGVAGFLAGSNPERFFDQLQSFLGRLIDSLGPFVLCASWLSILPKTPNWAIYFLLAAISWSGLANIVRAGIIRTWTLPYIEAARASGLHPVRVFWVHVLPELWFGVRPYSFALFSGFVGIQGALGFLGLGGLGYSNLGYLLFDFLSSLSSLGFAATSAALMLLLILGHAASRADLQAGPDNESRRGLF